jgi:hypothetical protein
VKQNTVKKNHYSIAICILVILTACTSHRLQNFSDNDIPLDQLVNHLPANDSVESTLIFNAILDYRLEGWKVWFISADNWGFMMIRI